MHEFAFSLPDFLERLAAISLHVDGNLESVRVATERLRHHSILRKETNMRVEVKMIQVEDEGVSFIFSPHSYSPDTCATTGRKYQQLETLNPMGMRASLPSSTLNDVIWPRFHLLHRAKLISTPINAELKRGFKYLTAAVDNMQ